MTAVRRTGGGIWTTWGAVPAPIGVPCVCRCGEWGIISTFLLLFYTILLCTSYIFIILQYIYLSMTTSQTKPDWVHYTPYVRLSKIVFFRRVGIFFFVSAAMILVRTKYVRELNASIRILLLINTHYDSLYTVYVDWKEYIIYYCTKLIDFQCGDPRYLLEMISRPVPHPS